MKMGNTVLIDVGIEVDGKRHRLSPQRRRLLEAVMRAKGACVGHERLIDAMWDGRDDGPNDKALKVQICYLRKNLRAAGSTVQVENVFGYGYAAVA